jgi:succinate dehydrogenase/fumarate reductase flavoprotein subunit
MAEAAMEIISRKTTGRVYDAVIVGPGAAGGMAAVEYLKRGEL